MSKARRTPSAWQRLIPWFITAVCFSYLYFRLARTAPEGTSVAEFLLASLREVSWVRWLALMIPYSFFYFLVDSLVVWRVINWFNTKVSLRDILPIRGSAYILSILNEQVSKGAIALYLNRRDGVPGWQVASSMLFIMFCEFYYLLGWASVGSMTEQSVSLEATRVIPWITLTALAVFVVFHAFFSGRLWRRAQLRSRQIFHAFRQARVWQYGALILIRSPAMIAAIPVYALALGYFGISATLSELVIYLPIVFFTAAAPIPLRALAAVVWAELYPENAAAAGIFGVLQHNFFIFFNAVIGLVFLRRASRELFGPAAPASADDLQ